MSILPLLMWDPHVSFPPRPLTVGQCWRAAQQGGHQIQEDDGSVRMTGGAKRKGPTLLRAKSTFRSLSLPLHVGNEYFISFSVHRQINVEEQCPSANSRLNDVCWLKSPLNDVHEQNYPLHRTIW
jgi:hypothetical protein